MWTHVTVLHLVALGILVLKYVFSLSCDLGDYHDTSPSRWVTTLPSLVAIGTAIVEI